MSKATDTEIKDLILTLDQKFDSLDCKVDLLDKKFDSLDRKVDLLTQKVNSIDETVKKLDGRIWAVVVLSLGACLTAILRALNL